MTEGIREPRERKVLYALAIHNVDKTHGLHVGICRESQIPERVERYKRKIYNRQIRREFQSVRAFGDVHIVTGAKDQLLELKRQLQAGLTVCPCCDKSLVRERRGINSATKECYRDASHAVH